MRKGGSFADYLLEHKGLEVNWGWLLLPILPIFVTSDQESIPATLSAVSLEEWMIIALIEGAILLALYARYKLRK